MGPRKGSKDDKAHPPIHPVKFVTEFESKDHQNIYELLTRHFLASLSKNAEGNETSVEVKIGDEVFHATGTEITAQNYLEIYDKWAEKTMPNFEEG